jgi:hypothetical protein
MNWREKLIECYIAFINDYLTPEKFAEHNGLTDEEGRELINLCRKIASHPHPEA